MDSTNDLQNGHVIPDMSQDETQEETQATQAVDANSQSQSQEEKDAHLFGSLHPCNPAQQRIDLWRAKPKVTIGRRHDCDIILTGGKVSNLHAEISWDGKGDAASCVSLKDKNSTNGTFINGHRIEKGAYRILKQGNEISFGSKSSETPAEDYRYIFYHLAAGSPKTGLYAHYDLGPELGRGSFAIVYRAISKATGQWYAVKIIQESRRTGREDASNSNNINLQREISIMSQLKHPNICELKDVFVCDNNEINLVIELVEGGDLLEHILQGNIHNEDDARHITYQLCDALAYIHDKGVAHRDLKPENVLLTSSDPPQVKVADFGLAKVSDSLTMLRTMCGTPAYLAPEVVRQETDEGYDNLVDSWSVGVIVFSMLTSASPFIEDENQKDIRTRISERRIDWSVLHDARIRVSQQCHHFIDRLLQDSPRQRMSMRDALLHPWLAEYAAPRLGQTPVFSAPRSSGDPYASTSSIPADVSMVSAVDYVGGSSANMNGANNNNDERFSQGLQNLKIDSREEAGGGGAGDDRERFEDPPTPPSQRIPGLGTLRAEGSRMLQRRRDVLDAAEEDQDVVLPEPSVEMISNFAAQEQKRKARAAADGSAPGSSTMEKGPGKRVHAELSEVLEENGAAGDDVIVANGKRSGANKKGRTSPPAEADRGEGPSQPSSSQTSNKRGSKGKTTKPKSGSGDNNANSPAEASGLRRSNRNAQKAARTS
ncbi:hypothetical protein V5O48_009185 [Marasmius crinis-equi]|uniref:Pkinase-domain-containing protein n=1 Tax=Marasmius crinis-equi TaxID=585013 RepID=A0ABR3FBW9_9AGAR